MNRRERRKAERDADKRAKRILKETRESGAAQSVTEGDVPEWIVRAVEEDERRTSRGKFPLTVVRPSRAATDEGFVVMRFGTFLRLMEAGGIGISPVEEGEHE